MKRSAPSRTIGEVLPAVLKATAERLQRLNRLDRRWRSAVGGEVARHTKLVSIRRGTLYVQTDEPGVGFTVQLDTPRLLQRLNRAGEPRVEQIIVRAGDV